MPHTDLLTPNQLGFDINTSDVRLYDGVTFVTLSPTANPSLNAVLTSVDVKVTDLQAQITAIGPVIDKTSDISIYDGVPTFSCFSFVGDTLNAIIDELGLQICINNTAIGALKTTDISSGVLTPVMNAAPYPVGPEVGNVDESLIAIDAVIQIFDTDKVETLTLFNILEGALSTFIISGAATTIGGGAFDVDISEALFFVVKFPTLGGATGDQTQAATTVVVTASKDNYIRYDLALSAYVITSVALAAPEPVLGADELNVALATTDGSGITGLFDRRDLASIGSINLKDEAILAVHIANGIIPSNKLIASGVSEGTVPFANVTVNASGIITAAESEVTFTALADEEFLQFDSGSSKWVNVPLVGAILPAGASNGDVLTFNTGSGDWEAIAPIAFTAIPLAGTTAPVTGDLELTNGVKLFVAVSSIEWNTNDITIAGDELIVSVTDMTVSAESTFSANMILTESAAPGSPTTNGVVMYAADRGAIAGTSSLNIVTEDDTKHIIGDLVGFGTLLPDPSAAVEVNSTTGGFRVPNMTTGQRDAINGGSFAEGLIIYNTTNNQFQGRTNNQWINLG